eukprot:CAMPEP_0202693902 /NCGR_PEP_ID=MMETSP1385-20130828/7904_1 /ASSEMBLY_ACC=CAM_ASM_000861 /TAXON_ID=933848 /ORGANISM="Elphidium margaritaceum" /LENGTH=500 /DNA_ID=CAMNT_0049349655 /DNA_START=32 /DNA_END=1534 /DNA_ORIENTATION=-
MDDNTEEQSFIPENELPQSNKFSEARLDYGKAVYRDVCCAIIYYLCLAAVVGVTVWIWVSRWPEIEAYNQHMYDNAELAAEQNSTDLNMWPNDMDYTGLVVTLVSCAVIGIVFGFIWLCVLRCLAGFIIKVMLFLSIALWTAVAVLGFLDNEIVVGVVGAVFAVLMLLYTICIWGRIRFASVLLELGSMIIGKFSGVVVVQVLTVLFTIIWFAVIAMCAWGYFIITSGDAQVTDEGYIYYNYDPNGWVIVALLMSLYWTLEVNSNISHCTACGVAAVWYFTPRTRALRSPTYKAFNRSMTSSFGSICLGSLFVAIIEMLRALVNAVARGERNICAICVRCCLGCLEWCVRYFNKYAYAHCAIYGVSFFKAAAQTWNLFSNQLIMALINDDLSGLGLFAGNLCSLVVCGLSGYGIAYSFYKDYSDPEVKEVLLYSLAVYGCIVGFILCWMVLVVVRSAIVTLFVCFAEEPAILANQRREEFDKLAEARPHMKQIVENIEPV